MRDLNIAPHVARNTTNRASAIDGRTTRHPGRCYQPDLRKRIEESFAWIKTIAGLHKTKHKGLGRVAFQFIFAMAAYNLIRMPRLLSTAPWRLDLPKRPIKLIPNPFLVSGVLSR